MDVAIMKEIVRQNDRQLKEAVYDIIDSRPWAAISRLDSVSPDKVPREAQDKAPYSSVMQVDSPVDEVVSDWIGRTREARAQTLIISQLNEDRKAINQAIHESLAKRKELGDKAVMVPVLEKISHTRHQFNRTGAWEAGMVVKRGDSYQKVTGVDHNGDLISVRNADGKMALYSPRELLTGDVELFKRDSREFREGDELRFTLTTRDAGQLGNERYRVSAVRDNGELELTGKDGTRVINPKEVRHEQHIDYAWAVTGYGAQGASSPFVIALEGVEAGRKMLAKMRAFYISVSRGKDHVQIYTDNLEKWLKQVRAPETEPRTAHDVLKPETERKQARAIWAMGTPLGKTSIGRTWKRHEGMTDQDITARIIPATRRFPEPAMAFPLYDRNGKSAGLSLVSLVAGPQGRLTLGDVRMVATEGAQGAVLQRSRNGTTVVAGTLEEAMTALKQDSQTGVVWQVGDAAPSDWMLKVTKGTVPQPDAEKMAEQRAAAAAEQAREQAEALRQSEELARQKTPDTASSEKELPQVADVREALAQHAAGADSPVTQNAVPQPADIRQVQQVLETQENALQDRADNIRDSIADRLRAEPDRDQQQLEERAKRVRETFRDEQLIQKPSQEPGINPQRTLDHDEPAHTRTIQKER